MSEPKHADNVPSLVLNLFGPLEVRVHDTPLARLHSRKGLWLLALLALRQGRTVERDWIVGTLWPESSESQGLYNLRQNLSILRHALDSEGARLCTPTRHTLALDVTGAHIDVLTFDAAVKQGDIVSLQNAAALYRGPLLEGCAQEWALPERTAREQAYLSVLERLAEQAITDDDAPAAIGYMRQAIGVSPLQESAHRILMQAFAAAGDYAAVIVVYRDLRLYLRRELRADPDPQTTSLFTQIRGRVRRLKTDMTLPSSGFSPPPIYSLPHSLTELIGREEGIAQIAGRLRQKRLVTLMGTGGVGKTSMAIAVAEAVVEEYADGAWFVELAALSDPKQVAQAIASTLDVHEEPGRSLEETLLHYLKPKIVLLVLDNCEHLLPVCALLAETMLKVCRGLKILATSREVLNIAGEQPWRVPSLSVPDLERLPAEEKDVMAALMDYDAVRLFVERVLVQQPDFVLGRNNGAAVAQVCHRLDGIPLALILAAARVKTLSVEQIATRLEDCFKLLTDGNRTVLSRHRTLRAMMDWSYDLLNEPERALLSRLSAFAGGWTLEAAEVVCTGEHVQTCDVLDLLTSLVDKSLVVVQQREGNMRFRLLETVRQYARDRLLERGEQDSVQGRHRRFFAAFVEAVEPKLAGPEQSVWLRLLESEHDNLRATLEGGQLGEALRTGGALVRFWLVRGYYSEGREWLAGALKGVDAWANAPSRAKALQGAGILSYAQGDYAAAHGLYVESLMLYREVGDKVGIAYSLTNLGLVATEQGDYTTAHTLYAESLALQQELGDKQGIAYSLEAFAALASGLGQAGRAVRLWGAAQVIRENLEAPLPPSDRLCYERLVAQARAALHAGFFVAAWSEGRALQMEQAISYALEDIGT